MEKGGREMGQNSKQRLFAAPLKSVLDKQLICVECIKLAFQYTVWAPVLH